MEERVNLIPVPLSWSLNYCFPINATIFCNICSSAIFICTSYIVSQTVAIFSCILLCTLIVSVTKVYKEDNFYTDCRITIRANRYTLVGQSHQMKHNFVVELTRLPIRHGHCTVPSIWWHGRLDTPSCLMLKNKLIITVSVCIYIIKYSST